MPQTNKPVEELQSIMRDLYNWCVNNNVTYIDVCLFPNKEDALKGLASYSRKGAEQLINDIEFRVREDKDNEKTRIESI